MKRFLAMFAIMAMIVSMFSGVAFAEATPEYEIDLDNEVIYYGTGSNSFKTLSGRILKTESGARVKEDFTLYVGETTETAIDVEDGLFSTLIATGSETYGVGNFTLTLEDGSDADQVTFRIVNEIELETPTTLEYTYPVEGQQIVQGVFVNGDGPAGTPDLDELVIGYVDEDGYLDDTKSIINSVYLDDETFGFLFDGDELNETGDIGIFIENEDEEYVLAVEGEVTYDEMTLSVSPTSLYRALTDVEQSVAFDFDLADKYMDETTDTALDTTSYYLGLVVETDDDDDVDDTSYDMSDDFDDQEAELNFEAGLGDIPKVSTWNEGTYTLTVQLRDTDADGFIIQEASVDIEIEDPDEYTLVNWDDDKELTVGDNELLYGTNYEIAFYDNDTTGSAIDVLDGTADPEHYIEVVYEGAGFEEKTYTYDPNDILEEEDDEVDTLTVTPKETGVVVFTINVYDEDEKKVATFEKELDVVGLNLSVSPEQVVVDTENDFVVEITNEDGTPVNNADVYFVHEDITYTANTFDADDAAAEVLSSETNINNGIYLFEEVELDTVGKFDVVAFDSDDNMYVLDEAIEVLGEEVLVVDSDTLVMVNGIEEDIYVSVLDDNGDVVYPYFEVIQYDADGDEVASDHNLDGTGTLETGSRKDLDEDGVKEAIAVTVTPDEDAVEIVVRAYTDDDKKEMGEVTLEVQAPVLQHTGATVITENFETELEFTVLDPRDDSVIEEDITFVGNDTYFVFDQTIEALDADRDYVWTATVLASEVDWDEAEEEEDTVEVTVKMDDVEIGTIEVVAPTLTSSPEKVIIGSANNLVLTYLDGEGNPIEEYAIMLDGEEIGETDENGQVMYATATVSTLSLEFEAATDAVTVDDPDTLTEDESGEDIYTELTVKSGADITGPVVTATVDGNTAVISIADDTRVQKVAINGELVDMFFAMPEVTEMVTLNSGVNTFNVQAVDINNNYSQTTLELEPEMMTGSLEFTIGEESEYGTPELMEGTTMVPVRFAEQLGATVGWDSPTATVTYVAGDTVIELTIGSTTAVVNGENVQLSQAPYINDMNRTMVPLRMISEELGFTVTYVAADQPILIS